MFYQFQWSFKINWSKLTKDLVSFNSFTASLSVIFIMICSFYFWCTWFSTHPAGVTFWSCRPRSTGRSRWIRRGFWTIGRYICPQSCWGEGSQSGQPRPQVWAVSRGVRPMLLRSLLIVSSSCPSTGGWRGVKTIGMWRGCWTMGSWRRF